LTAPPLAASCGPHSRWHGFNIRGAPTRERKCSSVTRRVMLPTQCVARARALQTHVLGGRDC